MNVTPVELEYESRMGGPTVARVATDPREGTIRRIGLHARSETRFFTAALAAELRARCGAEIVLYCRNRQEIDFYQRFNGDGRFAELVNVDEGLESARQRLPKGVAIVNEARRWEDRLGTTINFLAVSHRHLGRGYSLGGYRHPRSRQSEMASYDDLLAHYCSTLDYWSTEIRDRRLDLMLNGGKEFAICARLAGIPYRIMNGSRYRNYHNWAWNEYFENPRFTEGYHRGDGRELADLPFDRPYDNHLHNRHRFFEEVRASRLLKRGALLIAQYGWWRFRGYEKARGYYLSSNLGYFWRIWRDWRKLRGLARTKLDALVGRPFVYFPLHLEPETALQGLSPEFFYQLSAIAAISRDLPAGTTLAVKEALGAVGRRPADFYGQIAEFKNVVLLDPSEPGFECAKRASATVTICGTAGLEAAMHGRPVVTFGRHNIYNVLPHVRVIEDESNLQAGLRDALLVERDIKEMKRNSQRFLKSVVVHSFDMRDYDYFSPESFLPDAVVDACTALFRSVEAPMLSGTDPQ